MARLHLCRVRIAPTGTAMVEAVSAALIAQHYHNGGYPGVGRETLDAP